MHAIPRLMMLVLLMALTPKAFALACLKDATARKGIIGGREYITGWDGTPVQDEPISEPIAVATALPKGTVLWRSTEFAMSVTCWQDSPQGGETVYFYLSPGDGTQVQLDPDLEMGVRLNTGAGTRDYSCQTMHIAHGHCRVELPKTLFDFYAQACNTNDPFTTGCPSKAQTRMLNFSVFLLKKSPPTEGKDGPMTQISSLPLFQLDGKSGLNGTPGRNFRVNITQLSNLRYVACESRLGTVNVDFGPISPNGAVSGTEIRDKPFTVTARKDCDSQVRPERAAHRGQRHAGGGQGHAGARRQSVGRHPRVQGRQRHAVGIQQAVPAGGTDRTAREYPGFPGKTLLAHRHADLG